MGIPKVNPSAVLLVMRSLGPRGFARLFLSKVFSINHYYICGKNIHASVQPVPTINVGKNLRPVTQEDIEFIKKNLCCYPTDDRREILARLFFYNNGFSNCYVLKEEDSVAYMQWIVFPQENEFICKHYPGCFYPLTEKQVMIENAFTFPRYRGRGYFQAATLQLLELAKKEGYNSAIAYVRKDRIMSLNELTRLGFKIIRMVSEYKVLGKVWRTL